MTGAPDRVKRFLQGAFLRLTGLTFLGSTRFAFLRFTRLAFLPMPLRWAVFVTALVGVPLALYHGIEAPLIRVGSAVVTNFSQTDL